MIVLPLRSVLWVTIKYKLSSEMLFTYLLYNLSQQQIHLHAIKVSHNIMMTCYCNISDKASYINAIEVTNVTILITRSLSDTLYRKSTYLLNILKISASPCRKINIHSHNIREVVDSNIECKNVVSNLVSGASLYQNVIFPPLLIAAKQLLVEHVSFASLFFLM